MYEDVFEWILEAFDDLNSMDDLADDLESIKCQVPALKFQFYRLNETCCIGQKYETYNFYVISIL